MANEISLGIKLVMPGWYKPEEKPQLLPKDLLRDSKMIQGEAAEAQILNAIKNYRSSFYSFNTDTHGFGVMAGSTSSADLDMSRMVTSTAMYSSFSSSVVWR